MNLSFQDTKNILLKTKVILLWLGNIYSDIKFYRKKTRWNNTKCTEKIARKYPHISYIFMVESWL